MQGDDGKYWVVTPADAQRLEGRGMTGHEDIAAAQYFADKRKRSKKKKQWGFWSRDPEEP